MAVSIVNIYEKHFCISYSCLNLQQSHETKHFLKVNFCRVDILICSSIHVWILACTCIMISTSNTAYVYSGFLHFFFCFKKFFLACPSLYMWKWADLHAFSLYFCFERRKGDWWRRLLYFLAHNEKKCLGKILKTF